MKQQPKGNVLDHESSVVPNDFDPSLNGFSGWLVVFIISRCMPILTGLLKINDMIHIIGVNPKYDIWIYCILAESILVSMGLSIIILYLISQRKIAFRNVFIVQCLLAYIMYLAIGFLSGFWLITWPLAIADIITVVGWFVFLYKSKRVKNTFIYSHINYDDI